MTESETHVCSLYLLDWPAYNYNDGVPVKFSNIITDIATNKFKLCKLSKDYYGSDVDQIVSKMLHVEYGIRKWIEIKGLTND